MIKKLAMAVFLSCMFFGANWATAQEVKKEDFKLVGVAVQKIDAAIKSIEDKKLDTAKEQLKSAKEDLKKLEKPTVPSLVLDERLYNASEVQRMIESREIYFCPPCRGWRFRDLVFRDGKWIKYVPGS